MYILFKKLKVKKKKLKIKNIVNIKIRYMILIIENIKIFSFSHFFNIYYKKNID